MSNNELDIQEPLSYVDGVKPLVAKKIHSHLLKGRRYFGSSGAYNTKQAFDPEYTEREDIKKLEAQEHMEAEREVTDFLQKWIKDKPGAVLVDSTAVPDWEDFEVNSETGTIDGGSTSHVVLIGSEVILIDTKRWKKKKGYSVHDDGQALMTNKMFEYSDVKMREGIMMWLEYLDEEASLTGILCINSEEASVVRNRNWYTQPYRLVEMDRLEELLNEKWGLIDEDDKTSISATLVAQVVVRCIKPYDPYQKVFDMKSLGSFR